MASSKSNRSQKTDIAIAGGITKTEKQLNILENPRLQWQVPLAKSLIQQAARPTRVWFDGMGQEHTDQKGIAELITEIPKHLVNWGSSLTCSQFDTGNCFESETRKKKSCASNFQVDKIHMSTISHHFEAAHLALHQQTARQECHCARVALHILDLRWSLDIPTAILFVCRPMAKNDQWWIRVFCVWWDRLLPKSLVVLRSNLSLFEMFL